MSSLQQYQQQQQQSGGIVYTIDQRDMQPRISGA